MPTKTEAIKAFLVASTHADLSDLYNADMECQVNVAQGNGERVDQEKDGKKWISFTDNMETWKSFRIPFNAATEPSYDDTPMTFNLAKHVDGIGMTGWDWYNKVSKWVAFDFDAITGHSEKHTSKLTSDELRKVQDIACTIPWVTVRHSTSGKGLHLYVFLDDVPTINHTEHAALGRSVLSMMSSHTGYNFESKVDICGGNMWVYHRKMIDTNGLLLIRKGVMLKDIPENWKEHVSVIKGSRKKVITPINADGVPDIEQKFDLLAAQRSRVKLDEDHLKLIKFLSENGHQHWWDADHHMLITHTLSLKQAHKELNYRGLFETTSSGSTPHNCFCFPMRRGAWSIRRYSPGVKEHASWDQDGSGWTRCYLNHDPTLRSSSMAYGGLEDPSGGYHFQDAESASRTAVSLGANVNIPEHYKKRPTSLKLNKDGRLIVEFVSEQYDNAEQLSGWLRKGQKWVRMYPIQRTNPLELDVENFDDQVRHLITPAAKDAGWVICADGKWVDEPLAHVKAMLKSMGLKVPEIDAIIGGSILKPWALIMEPFKDEYPGDRIWNRFGPQYKYPATLGDIFTYPTWTKILDHIGYSITDAVKNDKWCRTYGINNGTDYLKYWIASMFQFPTEPLPYLFIYGEVQNSGKSTLHEALSMLFYPGYQFVDNAVLSKSSFNAELEGTILAVIEETNLSNNNAEAYNRIKQWVTTPKLSIHRKHEDPYLVPNTAHFIQTANHPRYCPVFPGDSRITMIHVADKPKEEIPKRELMRALEKEAPDFLGALLSLEIPRSDTRLRLPVIETQDKFVAQSINKSALEMFIDECCFYAPGECIRLNEFYDKFQVWLDPSERLQWSGIRSVSAKMPDKYPKGRLSSDANWHWGNISFKKPETESKVMFVAHNEKLIRVERKA